MKSKQNKRRADSLLVLLLFAVFAVCILSVLLTGADAYSRLAQRDQLSYDQRTAAQYLVTRLHQSDRAEAVSVEDFQGVDALVFTEEINGAAYETKVYCYEGYLRELFTAAGSGFLPEDGEKIMEAQSLHLELQGQMLTAELLSPSGERQDLTLFLRSGRGAAS